MCYSNRSRDSESHSIPITRVGKFHFRLQNYKKYFSFANNSLQSISDNSLHSISDNSSVTQPLRCRYAGNRIRRQKPGTCGWRWANLIVRISAGNTKYIVVSTRIFSYLRFPSGDPANLYFILPLESVGNLATL